MQSKALKITKIVLNSIFYFLIAIILIFSIANINAGGKGGIPSIFGKGYLSVQSESMMPQIKDKVKKTSFNKGDIIFVNKLNNKGKEKLKIGDIITFYDRDLKALNTHRIVDVYLDVNGNKIGYVTQGDRANAVTPFNPDNLPSSGKFEAVEFAQIEAKYTGKWSGAGSALDWISDPSKGFIVVVILPTLAFLGFEIFLVIKNMMAIKSQKMAVEAKEDREKLKADMELEKEEMRKQLLEELRKEQELKELEKEISKEDIE